MAPAAPRRPSRRSLAGQRYEDRVRLVYELTAEEREAAVSAINRMLESKTLINNVALTLPLSDIVAAHEAVEGGKSWAMSS